MVTSSKKKVSGFQLGISKAEGSCIVCYSRKGLEEKSILNYKLLYKNGKRIRYIDTTTDFTIKLYKQDLGTD